MLLPQANLPIETDPNTKLVSSPRELLDSRTVIPLAVVR
jgi:hypothetical protein